MTETYRLFVLDGDTDYHCIATVQADNVDAAEDMFFGADMDRELEIDCIEDNSTMIVDYSYHNLVKNVHTGETVEEFLTYIVTCRDEPPTREEMFA